MCSSDLVDGDIEVAVAPERSWERSQEIQPPDRERPGERDSLESSRGLVNLLGVELAGVGGLDDCSCTLKHRGPVESTPEDLALEGARRSGGRILHCGCR